MSYLFDSKALANPGGLEVREGTISPELFAQLFGTSR